jgi:predicted ArsR family transcriptional regulator
MPRGRFKAEVVANIVTTNSGSTRTLAQLAAALGLSGNAARQAAEDGVADGTLERREGGGLPLRYAQRGKGV